MYVYFGYVQIFFLLKLRERKKGKDVFCFTLLQNYSFISVYGQENNIFNITTQQL